MNTSFSILYKLTVHAPDGSPKEVREGHNLVMRSAIPDFNVPGAISTFNGITRFAAGQGASVPNRRDSGAVTFSSAWIDAATPFVVTASAGFFVAADAGRLLKLASGEELAISAYTSATQVTVAAYPVAPANAQIGTVWYDNQTALEAIISQWGYATTFTPGSGALTLVTGVSGTATGTVTQTAQTATASSGYNITELGWLDNTGVLKGRAVISPVAVQSGDYLTCTLVSNYTFDAAAHAVSAVGTYGDFSGTSRMYGASAFDAVGVSANSAMIKPGYVLFSAQTVDVSTLHNTTANLSILSAVASTPSVISSPYPSRSVKRFSATWGTGSSGTVATLGLTAASYTGQPVWVHSITAPVAKTTLQSVTAAFDMTVTRTLVN